MDLIQTSLPAWLYARAQWTHRNPDNCGLLNRYEVSSPCQTRRALFYTFTPYGCGDSTDLQKILVDSLSEESDLVKIAKSLNTQVWGSYICWIEDKHTKQSIFFNDPLHSVRLYYRQQGKTLLIDPLINKLLFPCIKWNRYFLASTAITQFGNLNETPFADVNLLVPGHALIINMNCEISQKRIWPDLISCQPAQHSDGLIATSAIQAMSRIASLHQNLVVSLTGGIDCAAVALLQRSVTAQHRPIAGLHFYCPSSPELDERLFTAAAANAANISLARICLDRHPPFKVLSLSALPQIISTQFMYQSINDEICMMLDKIGGVLVDGHSGDQIFSSTPSPVALIDRYLKGNICLSWQAAIDLALLSTTGLPRISYGNVQETYDLTLKEMKLAESHLSKLGLFSPEFIKLTFQNSSSNKLQSSNLQKIAKDKVITLEQMICSRPCFGDRAFPPIISPLLTNPVIQAALSNPNYWYYDKYDDRILLQHAAARHSLCKSLWRRTTNKFELSLVAGLMKNQRAIKQLLHEGVLVQQGILTRQGIDQAFGAVALGDLNAAITLSLPICVEMFCNKWETAKLQ